MVSWKCDERFKKRVDKLATEKVKDEFIRKTMWKDRTLCPLTEKRLEGRWVLLGSGLESENIERKERKKIKTNVDKRWSAWKCLEKESVWSQECNKSKERGRSLRKNWRRYAGVKKTDLQQHLQRDLETF